MKGEDRGRKTKKETNMEGRKGWGFGDPDYREGLTEIAGHHKKGEAEEGV